MKITKDKPHTTHVHKRTIEFEGAEPILLERRYSHGGKEFLPDGATAQWNHGEPIKRIVLEGGVLNKARTTGKLRTTVNYVTPDSKSWDSAYTINAPQWLLDLFADSSHTTPEGAAE